MRVFARACVYTKIESSAKVVFILHSLCPVPPAFSLRLASRLYSSGSHVLAPASTNCSLQSLSFATAPTLQCTPPKPPGSLTTHQTFAVLSVYRGGDTHGEVRMFN